MALFNQPLFSSVESHPVHVTLNEPRSGIRSLFRNTEDPYYNKSSHHRREDVLTPSFDVRESDSAFFLEGEFPGVGRKEEITIQKLGPGTLLVESNITRFDVEAEWGQRAVATLATAQSGKADPKRYRGASHGEEVGEHEGNYKDKTNHMSTERKEEKGKEGGIHSRLSERQVGHMQRSFTFPSPVDIDGLTARLKFGLLIMMVPKVGDSREESKKINIQD